ncbi:retrovirus-related Pol polyprotein from transposon 17.6 [Trichonephila clavipes]|nr:retrovirus-related Pol polyprotein from transposon 17.6 [Trichonephila clavipes]
MHVGLSRSHLKGNRYLITAICMSSKFPEAIPVSDISSVSVTDALLNIFSRMGFPVKYNVTRVLLFTSALTTEFFERFGILVRHSSHLVLRKRLG